MFLTKVSYQNSSDFVRFDFDPTSSARSRQVPIVFEDVGGFCARIDENIQLGNYIVTIVPTLIDKYVMVAYLLIPSKLT